MKEVFSFFFAALIVVGCLLVLMNSLEREKCLTKYSEFQPEYHGLITGCLVQYNGKTVPTETLRITD